MNTHYFKLHHWLIESTIFLPELPHNERQEADVFISEGKVKEHLPVREIIKKGVLWGGELSYEISESVVLLSFKDVGRFLLGSDNSITIDKLDETDYATIRLYLLGTCFGFLLIKQSIFPFHGSTILTSYGAVMFIGQSGWGKSTTAAKFIQEGHKLLTDDVCVVRMLDDGIPYAYPSSFRIKLWEDSISELCMDRNALFDIAPNFTKKQFYADHKLCQTAQPLTAIYALWPDEADILKIEPLKSNEKIAVLANNTFRFEAVDIFGVHKEHFNFCSSIAQSVPVKRLWRHVSKVAVQDLYQEVMKDLKDIQTTTLPHAQA